MASGSARQHWAAQFGAVEERQCNDIVAGIRDLSPATGTFTGELLATTGELLATNLRRLSDVF